MQNINLNARGLTWRIVVILGVSILLLLKATALFAQPERKISFAVIGDPGEDNETHSAVAAMINAWKPDFIVTLGDNRYHDNSFDSVIGKRYCNYLANVEPGPACSGGNRATNAFFPAVGNHDYSDGNGIAEYLAYFDLPGNERYYEFTRGPVHFFALNSNSLEHDGNHSASIQARWLRERLASSTLPWQVVFFHHAPYSSGFHGSYVPMQWPFAEWGADVVLAGHDHHYERIERDDILYFVNGAGQSLYPVRLPIAGSQIIFNADVGAMKVEATANRIDFQFYALNGWMDEATISTDSVDEEAAETAERPAWATPAALSTSPPLTFTPSATPTAQRVNREPQMMPTATPEPPNQPLLPLFEPQLLPDISPAEATQAVLNCLEGLGSCGKLQKPDCVDGNAICLFVEEPGPYGQEANQSWSEGERARYGQLIYAQVDRRRGAHFDNLLAGAPHRPKLFCRRPANHLNWGEEGNRDAFIAWSDFNPDLTEPAGVTVLLRNRPHLHWSTVPEFALRQNREGQHPIFVLNASFFTPESAPEGSHWQGGEMLRTDPNRTMVAFSEDGRRAEILWGDGAPIELNAARQLRTILCRRDADGELVELPQIARGVDLDWIHTAVGGGPVFVLPDPADLDEQGRPRIKVSLPGSSAVTTDTVPFNPLGENFGQESSPYPDPAAWAHRFEVYDQKDNPKTFVCVGERIILLGVAKEMSGFELGRRLVELGCHTAMGLDDNSATAFAWRQRYAQSLKHSDTFRYIANAIGIYPRQAWFHQEQR